MKEEKIREEIKKEKVTGRTDTQITTNTANIINTADAQLFPSLYAQVQSTLGLDVVQLGMITGIRTLAQSIFTPLWGWWSDRYSRKYVLAAMNKLTEAVDAIEDIKSYMAMKSEKEL